MAIEDELLEGIEEDPLLAGIGLAEEDITAPTGVEQALFPELKTSLAAPTPEVRPVTLAGGPGAVPTGFETLIRPEAVTTPIAPLVKGAESFPKRLLAILRTGEEITDPEAAVFGPEADVQRQKAEEASSQRKVLEDKIAAENREPTPEETKELFRLQELAGFKGVVAGGLEFISDPALAISAGAGLLKKIGRGAVGFVSGSFGKIKQSLTQLSDETLKAIGGFSGKGITKLEVAKDTAPKLGQKLEEFFINPSFPEEDVIQAALPKVRKIELQPVVDAIDDAKLKGRLSADINAKLDDLKKQLTIDETTGLKIKSLSAPEYVATRRNLDNAIGTAFDQNVPSQIKKKMIKIGKTMRKEIRKAAIDSKQPQIVEKLESMHDKFEAMDEIRRKVNNNSETFILNLFGKGKTSQQEALKQLEKLFKGDKRLEGAFSLAKMRALGEKLDADDFLSRGFATRGGGFTKLLPAVASPRGLNIAGEVTGGLSDITAKIAKAGFDAAQTAAIIRILQEAIPGGTPEEAPIQP